MNNHYSDYLKKNVSVKDLTFNEIGAEDKELLKVVKKAHIKSNTGFLIILSIGLIACMYFFASFIITPADMLIVKIISLLITGAGISGCAMLIYEIIAGIKGIRKGVVLAASREQENKDGRNTSYQFVFDIYMEDKDETLMSFVVSQEVFSQVEPGDGVLVVKAGRKVKVMQDPERKAVMDVSNIKSGI